MKERTHVPGRANSIFSRWGCATPWLKATRPTCRSCLRQGGAFLHRATRAWSSPGQQRLGFHWEEDLKQNYIFQNLFWAARTVSTPASATAPSHPALSADQLKKVKIILKRNFNGTDFLIIADTTQPHHQRRQQQTIEIRPKRRKKFNQTSSEMDIKLAIRQD